MIVEALKLVRDAIEQGVDLNLIGAKHILDQAIADLEKQDKFCDDNCVWTDHHKDCVRSDIKQEPVAMQMDVIVVNLVREGINKHRARELAEHFIKHTHPQPKAEKQKPVAWQYTTNFYNPNKDNGKRLSYSLGFAQVHAIPDTIEPLYTHPQPKQKPLTVEQIDDLHGEANRGFCIEREDYFKAFRDAEAAHGITSDIKKS